MSYNEWKQNVAVMRDEYQQRIYDLCDTLEFYDSFWKAHLAEAMFDLPESDMAINPNAHVYIEIINDICRRKCCYYALDELFFRKAEMLCKKYCEVFPPIGSDN